MEFNAIIEHKAKIKSSDEGVQFLDRVMYLNLYYPGCKIITDVSNRLKDHEICHFYSRDELENAVLGATFDGEMISCSVKVVFND